MRSYICQTIGATIVVKNIEVNALFARCLPRWCRIEATRTPDPYVPNVVRYQLRYYPIVTAKLVRSFGFWRFWTLILSARGIKKGVFLKKLGYRYLVYQKKVVILHPKREGILFRKRKFGVWCNWQHYRFWSCLSWFESGYPNNSICFGSESDFSVWGMV